MGYIFLSFSSAGWNMDVLGGAWAAILDHKVETMCLRMAEYQNKRACDPGDSKVATVDFTAYIYVKKKTITVGFVFVCFCLFC